ncbi:MAG: 50S ribosomal protein L6 [Gammaproteobacteria bacterium]|nr:50S ribosomal protein L6 [Gammaproteobacteria bacterium]
MARAEKNPVAIPSGVDVNISGRDITVKGSKGTLAETLHEGVDVSVEDSMVKFASRGNDKNSLSQTGTARALVRNMIVGVSDGFEKKLTLVGVGYRAQAQGNKLNLSLGFSHPIDYEMPEGIAVETPSQTEVVIKGINKQVVGQVAAEIRAFRPPEPYKGKGVRYSDEYVVRKEAKKK